MKKRIISAALALAIIIPLIIIGGSAFAVGCGIIALIAYKEIIDLKVSHGKIPFLVKILGAFCTLLLVYMTFEGYSIALGLSYKAVASTILAMMIPVLFYNEKKGYTTKDAIYLIGFILLIGIFFNALILIRFYDIKYLIFLILIAILTDTFAYITGMLIGKHKLCPSISPNKTWEGSIGGSLISTIVASIFYFNLIDVQDNFSLVILIILSLSIIGQMGDLLLSKIKRENEIKDFSKIMPGHGGVLDRVDALMFVVLAYLILFTII